MLRAPGPVGSVRATPLRGSIRVAWSSPADLGGATSVTYEYRVGKGPWLGTTATSMKVKGVKGKRITVQVRALNDAGPGPVARVVGIPR